MAEQETAQIVHGELQLEAVRRGHPFPGEDARVVHEGVESPIVLGELLGEGDNRCLARQVDDHQRDLRVLGVPDDLLLGLPAPSRVPACKDDGPAEPGKPEGGRLADPRGRAGDDPDSVLQRRRPNRGHDLRCMAALPK